MAKFQRFVLLLLLLTGTISGCVSSPPPATVKEILPKDCQTLKDEITAYNKNFRVDWQADSLANLGLREKYAFVFLDSVLPGCSRECVLEVLGKPDETLEDQVVYNLVHDSVPGSNSWLHIYFDKDSRVVLTTCFIE